MKEWFPRHQRSINICSKYMSQWRGVNVVSHVGWLVMMLASGEARRGWEMVSAALYVAPREVTRAEWHQSFSWGEIYKFELQRPKQFPHKIIICNSFCYTFIPELRVKTATRRSLLKRDTEYNWNETHEKVFQNLKKFNTLWRYPLGPHVTSTLLTISLLYGRWSTSGSDRGIAHFFTATRNAIKGAGGKNKKQTNKTNNRPGVNSSAEGELCNIVHMCAVVD